MAGLRLPASPSYQHGFADIPEGSCYADAAAWARDEGLVSGALFHGNDPATRAATMTYLWKLAGQPEAGTPPFSDVPRITPRRCPGR